MESIIGIEIQRCSMLIANIPKADILVMLRSHLLQDSISRFGSLVHPMTKIVEPEEVFSEKEMRRLDRWMACYNNPIKPAIIASLGTFLGAIALIILLVKLNVRIPSRQGGIEEELLAFSCFVGIAVWFLSRVGGEIVFASFDKRYFQLTGQSERQYLNALIDEVRQEASLQFSDIPNGSNDSMFNYSEEQRVEAYKAYEADYLKGCALEEDRLKFKAYVARRNGFRVPFK